MSPETPPALDLGALASEVEVVLGDARVIERYRSRIRVVGWSECLWWTGAISGRGHGRFWLAPRGPGRGRVVIAHRFAWALTYGAEALAEAPLLRHTCDNPLCQDVEHMAPAESWENSLDWAVRRHRHAWPLRDSRGARGRALAIRDALRRGEDGLDAARAGLVEDEAQLSLFAPVEA